MTVSMCLIPLRRDVWFSAATITEHCVRTWPSLPTITGVQQSDDAISFSTGLARVILGRVSTPVQLTDLAGPVSAATLWPDAADELLNHAAHVMIAVSGNLDELTLATLLTQVSATVSSVCDDALGVYWNGARKLVRKDIVRDIASSVLPQGPPLDLWVDFRIAAHSDQSVSGFTTGLQSLGLMEIEAVHVPDTPEELHNRLMHLSLFLIENGPALKSGDVIGADVNEHIGVEWTSSEFGHSGQVIRLNYEVDVS